MFLTFTVWIKCSSDLKILEVQKFFSITRTIFSHSRSNNFGNKIPFLDKNNKPTPCSDYWEVSQNHCNYEKKNEISKRWSINKTNLHENIFLFCFLKLLTELEFRWIWQNIANLQIVIACAGGTRKRGKNPTVALQLSSLSLLSYWVWKDAWTCPAQDIFCPRNTFCNWSIFSLWNWYCQNKTLCTCSLDTGQYF